MSAQYGETCSHASTMKRLSKSPTVATCQLHNARRNTLATPHSQRSCLRSHTHITKEHVLTRSQLQLSRHAAHFPVIDTHTPLVRNTADHACPCQLLHHWHSNAATRRVQPTNSHPTANQNVESRSAQWQLALNDLESERPRATSNTSIETLRKWTKQTCL